MTTAKGVDSPTVVQNLLRIAWKFVIQCSMPGRGSKGIKFTKFDLSDIKVQEALAVVGCNLSD